VLGASGSVGRAVLAAIAADPRLVAIAGLHRPSIAPPVGLSVRQTRVADATDRAQLTRALRGVTHVINAVGGSPATLRAATTNLCAAARAHPGTRLIHISSMAVYGAATGLVAEDAPLMAQSAYAAAKIACESEVMHHAVAGHQAVILRPGIVYGPGSTQWTARIARLLAQRRLGDLGPAGDGWCNLIHEHDIASAVIAACLTSEATGLAFNIATHTPPTWNDYLVAFARAVGATPVHRISGRRLAIESRLAAPLLHAARRVATRAGLPPGPDPIPLSLLRLFAQRIRLNPARADRLLRFARTPDAAGIAALAAA
jgi:nucleoside-diphosphate-sugar epimerase